MQGRKFFDCVSHQKLASSPLGLIQVLYALSSIIVESDRGIERRVEAFKLYLYRRVMRFVNIEVPRRIAKIKSF